MPHKGNYKKSKIALPSITFNDPSVKDDRFAAQLGAQVEKIKNDLRRGGAKGKKKEPVAKP